jgi:hypothetical protein
MELTWSNRTWMRPMVAALGVNRGTRPSTFEESVS